MYESFFSLKVKPFALLPNPEFLFLSRSHKKALTYLDYAIRNRAGFILLTGEIGSGKTTLLRDLFNTHHQNIVLSRIFNTKVNSEQLLSMINDDFGLPVEGKDKLLLLRELNDFLMNQHAHGNRSILVIDEAQNLAPEVLEELRLLSNLETDSVKLLHIVLAGQPELRKTLSMPELLQLRQRISCFCHIQPLEEDEIEPYILHRLERAGNRQAAVFSPESIDLIWRYSRGIPRLINTICDFLLLLAYADGERTMTPELARAVIDDLDFENCYWGNASPPPMNREVNSSLSTSHGVATQEPDDSTVKEMLAKILSRIDHLEKTEFRSAPENIISAATTPGKVKQESNPAAALESTPVVPNPAPKKKRGFFDFLFRKA